ncbi:Transposase [Cordylochernes scorpioides]|uniref:Transposase n=1 Tax=Cordylochernes scorpioides TaxID=51811 RepID=A0ABY6LWT9_9ARAC|nr:Transposase [Cordylochernes scorpioides]
MPGHRKRMQFKQTDAFTRGMVIGLKRAGWSIRQIAADTHLGASTVHRLWRRWLEQGNVAINRNAGATRVTSARVDRRILRQAVAAPQGTCTAILQHVQDTLDHSISTRTISRRLVANGLHSFHPLRRLPLTPPNRRQRLEWCRARSTWMTEWHRVVFSDESRFCLSSDNRRVRVWRRRGERSNPAAIVERPSVRQRGIMVWGTIAYDSRSPLLRIQGTMTAQRYVDDVLYQQDNARLHTAHISQQALQDVQMLPWPPYSPDLSPIEHVWDIIGRRLHAFPQPRSEDELWQMVEREWRAIPQDAIRTLIDSLPRRVAACIAVRDFDPATRRKFCMLPSNAGFLRCLQDNSCRRLPLTPPNRRQRLEWCRARSTWMTEWHRVVFSDESRFCLSSDSRRVRVRRRRGERSNPAAIVERPTVRQRGIMVWGAIAYDSRSPLLRIQGTMTAQRYVDDVLRPVTLPYLQVVPNALYQQDNARPHTARISQQALQDVQMLPWPPYSPDLSPIEHVWDIIGRRLHALPQPRSEDELWQMVEREWRAIPQDAIRTLIDSLPRRVAACIAVREVTETIPSLEVVGQYDDVECTLAMFRLHDDVKHGCGHHGADNTTRILLKPQNKVFPAFRCFVDHIIEGAPVCGATLRVAETKVAELFVQTCTHCLRALNVALRFIKTTRVIRRFSLLLMRAGS